MKKALSFLAALCAMTIVIACGMPYTKADASGEGLRLAVPLEGIWKPADVSQASFSYRLPQFEPEHESAVLMNQYYQECILNGFSGIFTEQLTEVDYEVTSGEGRYLSVMLRGTSEGGMGLMETIHADTFALDGIYAGKRITLSQLLGVEQTDAEKVLSQTVCSLIWQIVERDIHNAEGDYPEGVSEQDIEAVIAPQNDFYLDQDGNVVFYIQSGELAGEIAGILTFPFSTAELMDALSAK